MATVTKIYDGLVTLVEANTTNYTRMADAYDVENNYSLSVVKGFSLGFLSGRNTERQLTGSTISLERDFKLTLTNLYVAIQTDPVTRSAAEKALLEDAFAVYKALQVVTHLGGAQVYNTKFIDDSGIAYVYADNQKAISIVSTISVEYME